MKRKLPVCCIVTACFLFTAASFAQTTIVQDNFTNRSLFKDNTLLLNWGLYNSPQSGFSLQSKTDASTPTAVTYNSICLTDSGVKYSGYIAANSLKTLTGIDYEFPTMLDRNAGDIKIEFDGIWNGQDNGGESGRLVVTLLGNYPSGGGQFDQVYDTSLIDPFGKPLYNIRIRNTSTSNGSLMLYGAGLSTNPKWEIYNTSPGWWLPGFSVQSGGGSPGSGADYPASGTKKSSVAATSTTLWKHYTWLIKPEKMELYFRNSNQPASADVLLFFMQTPSTTDQAAQLTQINAAHGTNASQLPPYYNYYNSFKAVRFYWRGVVNSHLANVKVSQSGGLLAYNKLLLQKPVLKDGKAVIPAIVLPAQNTAQQVILQHSSNGRTFANAVTVNIPAGNTNITITHAAPAAGSNYYRLHQNNAAGEPSYSNVVNVTVNQPAVSWAKKDAHTVQFTIPDTYTGQQLTVRDISGRVLVQKIASSNTITVSTPHSGILVFSIGSSYGKIVL
jgi:hypothetical protein